jgi:metallo-beta-lactamase family protein
MLSIQFLGAAGTVTGSKHLVRFPDGQELLVDCGLFQGAKEWRERNWQPLPVPRKNITWLALTHAHLDHVGFLPRIYSEGFRSPVICTPATEDLARIVLPDSGHLQEEEAAFANKKGFSKHKTALPLYTYEQAVQSLNLLTTRPFHESFPIGNEGTGRFLRAGHILGSGFFEFSCAGQTILFSGDLGRPRTDPEDQADPPIPEPVMEADYLLLESTYGNRLHTKDDPRPKLAAIFQHAQESGGSVVIPAFAVERTEKLMFMIKKLIETGQAPRLPVYVDSPMAVQAVQAFVTHKEEYDAATRRMIGRYGDPSTWPGFHFCKTREESMAINSVKEPHVIISASGMLAGGRVLHHLERHLGDPRSTVLFVGFQAPGGRGQLMQAGAKSIRMFGKEFEIKCRVETLDQFSDHADYEEILGWLKNFKRPPKRTFVVHGEPAGALALQERIVKTYGWDVHIAKYLETVNLE